MKRKILLLVLFAFLYIGLTSHANVYADENIREKNVENVAKYALSFVNAICGEKGLTSGEVLEIKDETDSLSGYCIDILDHQTSYGYVIVKFSDNVPVVSEYCIEKGAKNPYEILIINNKLNRGSDLLYYSIGLNEYQVYSSQNEVMYGFDKKLGLSEFELYKKNYEKYKKESILEFVKNHSESLKDIDLNYSPLDGYTVISDNYTGSYINSDVIAGAYNITYYCSADVNNAGLTYACAVVALSNLMKYYKYMGKTNIGSNFSLLYSTLWNYAGTASDGSTPNGNEAPAAMAYMANKGYSISYDDYLWDNFSSFVQDTADNRPMLFTYEAYFNGSIDGHATFCVGYTETSDYNYLRIADGWNYYLRYINFNGYNYTRKDGWSFTEA